MFVSSPACSHVLWDLQSHKILGSHNAENDSFHKGNTVNITSDNKVLVRLTNGACPADEVISDVSAVMICNLSQKVHSLNSENAQEIQLKEMTKPSEVTSAFDVENKSIDVVCEVDKLSVLVDEFKMKTFQMEDDLEDKAVQVEDGTEELDGHMCLNDLEDKAVQVQDCTEELNGHVCLNDLEHKVVQLQDEKNGQICLDVLEGTVVWENGQVYLSDLVCLRDMGHKPFEVPDCSDEHSGKVHLNDIKGQTFEAQDDSDEHSGKVHVNDIKGQTFEAQDDSDEHSGKVHLNDIKGQTFEAQDDSDEHSGKVHLNDIECQTFEAQDDSDENTVHTRLGDFSGEATKMEDGAAKLKFLPFSFSTFDALCWKQIMVMVLAFLFPVSGGLLDFMGPLDLTAQIGERAVLTCNTSRSVRLKWFKDGIQIYNGYDFLPTLQHLYSIINDTRGQFDLVINNFTEYSVGNYTCYQPGDLQNKTARLILGSVISTQRYTEMWTSDHDVSGSMPTINTPAINTVAASIGAIVAVLIIIAIIIKLVRVHIQRRRNVHIQEYRET